MTDVELARIPAGELPVAGARRGPRVEAFEMGVYPVTEEQLGELLGITAAHPRRPAVDLSWLRAVRFCNALSEWEGLDTAYAVDGDTVRWDEDADGYRLPTELEWEYACRAGSGAAQYGPLSEVAWTASDGVSSPQPVGGRHPNLFGLFDTLGNVSEWCWDLVAPDAGSRDRVFRDGSFADAPTSVRAGTRRGAPPSSTHDDIGLRVARGPYAGPPGAPA
ncbi:SUMF1/EgtB/PvdO family nonheme iron enzyme [Microbacterium sp. cf332]|uniref:formylglycine-generating enzyme family protein n=1 Tax=Microbacterium sp. cf332 TaxID=1761804 RepID=UPI0008851496|nr:SUMF1/EgtB/PvdO family nonheme iron enzyme [Microbacterium sp. cf332]SDQ63767.1 Formylglycine-generating enzyme, required for sulfatase activity, contains SUMF1/FGE domain [Microbacterium sp. cf332]